MLTILGMYPVNFNFGPSKDSSQNQTTSINVPAGTTVLECFLTSSDFSYTNNNQYGFGRMQVSVQGVGPGTVLCAVTLRTTTPTTDSGRARSHAWPSPARAPPMKLPLTADGDRPGCPSRRPV